MRFTVVWSRAALDELADVWLASADRNGVTDATAEVDRVLAVDADFQGIAFYGDRLLTEPPLQVVFAVSVDDRLVRVLSVW